MAMEITFLFYIKFGIIFACIIICELILTKIYNMMEGNKKCGKVKWISTRSEKSGQKL